jgi:diguanylate cyclase (GGDEF)-like protein
MPSDPQWHQRLCDCLVRIEDEIKNIDPEQGMEHQMQELTAAADIARGRTRKLIYLCEDDAFQRMSLATQIRCFGFEVVAFGELEPLKDAVLTTPPDAVVMDIIFPDRPLGGTETIDYIHTDIDATIPTVFISSQSDLPHRLSAVRAGSSAYFVKPVTITDLCDTLAKLTSTEAPDPYRVMIVDDDPRLAEYHAAILQEAGMVTKTLNDPLQAIETLLDFEPDLILMDMYMPSCNGMELATAIRQIGAYYSIPIVFLSSETDQDKQFHAMQMGGDEFLTKPIKPEHLVTSVAVRAERMKTIRSLMVRDSMTGLYNHTASKEHLANTLTQSEQHGGEGCLAVIDVDHFKLVNDTYGHPIGDRVLVALARLLRQRLHKQDFVGRTGGEEFVIIFTDCPLPKAVGILNQLRENFSAVTFHGTNATFSCGFSAGVTPFSLHADANAIWKAADAALYKAKQGGRNRVVAMDGSH